MHVHTHAQVHLHSSSPLNRKLSPPPRLSARGWELWGVGSTACSPSKSHLLRCLLFCITSFFQMQMQAPAQAQNEQINERRSHGRASHLGSACGVADPYVRLATCSCQVPSAGSLLSDRGTLLTLSSPVICSLWGPVCSAELVEDAFIIFIQSEQNPLTALATSMRPCMGP